MASKNSNQPPALFTLHDDEELESANLDTLNAEGGDGAACSNIENLRNSFPLCDAETLSAVLVACDNDLSAARRLLSQNASKDSLAKRTSTAEQSSNDINNTSSDAAIARYLQRQENAIARQHRASHDNALTNTMQAVISSLKEIIVPALVAHFSELVLPNYVQNTEDNSSSMGYELRDLQVVSLTIPSEHVTIRPSLDRQLIFIHLFVANVDIEVGKWKYNTRVASDSGRARTSLHAVHIDISLGVQANCTRLEIAQCDVLVDGPVRFKVVGAAADWAYNAVAVVVKPLLVSILKQAVVDATKEALTTMLDLTQPQSS